MSRIFKGLKKVECIGTDLYKLDSRKPSLRKVSLNLSAIFIRRKLRSIERNLVHNPLAYIRKSDRPRIGV